MNMDLFDLLTMIGGLCLFLFGMELMGQALERRAGSKLRTLLEKMTTNKLAGFLTGCGVTAVIQSSSATTVMVVGFVNSGLMTLKQAINVIMGANVGTTITAWILSLSGIDSKIAWIQLLKPSSFTPILALIGIIMFMFKKRPTSQDTGTILLGFATLMYGMETMSDAVSGLADSPSFREVFTLFQNPILGMLVGAVLTAIIQSSSASVGILQALSATGQITYGAALPIIMGQNIGTCITAILSSIGATKNAKRAAFIHLAFNVIGSAVLLVLFYIVSTVLQPALLGDTASKLGIAVFHTIFSVLRVAMLMPASAMLEKLAMYFIKDTDTPEEKPELDERLLATPPLALEQCHSLAIDMASCAVGALKNGLQAFEQYTPALAESIRKDEDRTDRYEDIIGTYLAKLSTRTMSTHDSEEATELLKIIGDFERISDHGVNIIESVEEMREKSLIFSPAAQCELSVLMEAVSEILDLSLKAFMEHDLTLAEKVEPLEQVIDGLKEQLRSSHILRLQQGNCSIEAGFVWSDLLTNMERVSDHCSNIAGCMIDTAQHSLNIHETLKTARNGSSDFQKMFHGYVEKYDIKERLIKEGHVSV